MMGEYNTAVAEEEATHQLPEFALKGNKLGSESEGEVEASYVAGGPCPSVVGTSGLVLLPESPCLLAPIPMMV